MERLGLGARAMSNTDTDIPPPPPPPPGFVLMDDPAAQRGSEEIPPPPPPPPGFVLMDNAGAPAATAAPAPQKPAADLTWGEMAGMTWPARMAKEAYGYAERFVTAPGEVVAGKLDPLSDEAIERMAGGAQLMAPFMSQGGAGGLHALERLARTRAAIPPVAAASAATRLTEEQLRQRGLVLAGERQGIDLPPATVMTNPLMKGATKQLSDLPYIGTPIQRGVKQATQDVEQGVTQAAESFGPSRTLEQAGEEVLTGVQRYGRELPGTTRYGAREAADELSVDDIRALILAPSSKTGFRPKQKALYDRVGQMLPKGAAGAPTNARQAIADVAAVNAEAGLGLGFTGKTGEVLNVIADPNQTLPYSGMRTLRTKLRELRKLDAANKTLSDDDLDHVYHALTRDIHELVTSAGGPKATRLLQQADRYTAHGKERLQKTLKPLGAKSAEGAAGTLLQWAQPGRVGNFAKLQQVRKSVGPNTWDELSAATIYEMARGKDGFSLAKLVTEYEKLPDNTRELLFRSTGKSPIANNLDDLATLARGLKDVEALGNPPGSGRYVQSAMAAGGSISLALGGEIMTAVSLLGAGRLGAHILSSKALTSWLTRAVRIEQKLKTATTPVMRGLYARQLATVVAELKTLALLNPEVASGLKKLERMLTPPPPGTAPPP